MTLAPTTPDAAPADATSAYGDLWYDGAPTEYGIEVFTEGDCWALAWYVAQLTGGRLVTLGWPYWGHVAVEVGPNLFLDATGLHTEQALAATWKLPVIVFEANWARTFADYEDCLQAEFGYPVTHPEVAAFADLLVAKYLTHPTPAHKLTKSMPCGTLVASPATRHRDEEEP